MKEIGVFENIDFVKQKIGFISEDLNGIPESYDDLKQMFYRAYPEYKTSLEKFFMEVDQINGSLGNIMKQLTPYLLGGLNLFLAINTFIIKARKFIKLMKEYQDITVSEFLERYFPKNSKISRILSHFGYPDMPGLSLAVSIPGMDDYWTVKTGMQSWADILADNFRKYGGELKLNSFVDKIITKNGAAVGVICKKTDYYADYVISASDYKKTFLKLLDKPELIPPTLWEKVNNAAVSTGFFTVYLGLKLSNEELRKYIPVPFMLYLNDDPGCDIYNSNDEQFFEKTMVMLYSPSMVNPQHAPNGRSSLMLQTMVPDRWMNNWGNGDRTKYKQLKECAMNTMIVKTAKLIAGLENLIEFKDAATPLTYERYTHNSDGASSSWNWNPRKSFYENSLSLNINTPVKNLYIGSCWAMANGGIPGALAAAYQCAYKVK